MTMHSEGAGHSINAGLEVAKATPSLGAIIIGWLHFPLETWAVWLGILFILLQMAHLLWRWWRDIKHERQRDRRVKKMAETPSDRMPL